MSSRTSSQGRDSEGVIGKISFRGRYSGSGGSSPRGLGGPFSSPCSSECGKESGRKTPINRDPSLCGSGVLSRMFPDHQISMRCSPIVSNSPIKKKPTIIPSPVKPLSVEYLTPNNFDLNHFSPGIFLRRKFGTHKKSSSDVVDQKRSTFTDQAFTRQIFTSNRAKSCSNLTDFNIDEAVVSDSSIDSPIHHVVCTPYSTHINNAENIYKHSEMNLVETPIYVFQVEYKNIATEEQVRQYGTVDVYSPRRSPGDLNTEHSRRIDATLEVTSFSLINRKKEIERYDGFIFKDTDGACGCSQEIITKDDRGLDYSRYHAHTLFKRCVICNRKPATFLNIHTLEGVCSSHVRESYKRNTAGNLFINLLDISTSLYRVFWCEKCKQFTWKYTDVYEPLAEQLAYSKGVYWGEAVRDIIASEYYLRLRVKAKDTTSEHIPLSPQLTGRNPMDLELVALGCSSQGWRATQEDAEAVIVISIPDLSTCTPNFLVNKPLACFCVFDGHGGDSVARIAARDIESMLRLTINDIKNDMMISNTTFTSSRELVEYYFTHLFESTFLALDRKIRDSEEGRNGDFNGMGSTACIVCISEEHIICANLGDSGAAMYFERSSDIIPLSSSHRITDEVEIKRIRGAGYSIHDYRIEGILAVPRAIGDYDFKQCGGVSEREQAVSAIPTVTVRDIPPSFLSKMNGNSKDSDDSIPTNDPCGIIIACDGLWDTLTSTEIGFCFLVPNPPLAKTKEMIPSTLSPCLFTPALSLFGQCIAPTCNDEGMGLDNVSMILVVPKRIAYFLNDEK